MNESKTTLMMKNAGKFFLCAFLSATSLLVGCSDDDPVVENEEELITTVILNFQELNADGTPVTGGVSSFEWFGADGRGTATPVIDPIVLKANTGYLLSIELLNESDPNDIEDVTEEIEEEKEEHQFFFTVTPAGLMTIVYADSDVDGRPVGLVNAVLTGSAGTGTLRVVLLHDLNKAAAGVAQGNPANAGGETDADVTFNVTIQN